MHPYATAEYAKALAHIGRPQFVESWQTHVLIRDWQGGAADAAGPYPLTCIAAASDLHAGLEQLRHLGAVSVTIVADGLYGPAPEQLKTAFAFARPFKTHYLFDPAVGAYQPSKHHRYEIRRAMQRGVEVRVVELAGAIDEWTALYAELVSRRGITGPQRFSRDSFAALAACKDLIAIGAYVGDEMVSCHLWFRHGSCVWSHLAASNDRGYAIGAAYAVYDFAIRTFSGHIVNMGGSAGVTDARDDGLARLKSGFANRTKTTNVFGAILDARAYRSLCGEQSATNNDYFPAYRTPLPGNL